MPPVGGDSLSGSSSRFSLSFDYTLRHSDRLYRGASSVTNAPDISTTFQRYSLTGAYKINDSLILRASAPYIYAVREENGVDDVILDGFSDLSFSAIWLVPQIDGLSFTTGLIAPTGREQDQPLVGIANPEVFQLGTGAWQGSLGLQYSWKYADWNFLTAFDASFPLETSTQGFRPAASFFWSTSASRSLTESLRGSFGLQLNHYERDVFAGQSIANTGSTSISLRPSLIWQINETMATSLSASIPVYREVNRTQIGAGPSLSLGMSWSF